MPRPLLRSRAVIPRRTGWFCWPGLLLLLSGCRTPPAHVSGSDPVSGRVPRLAVVVGQDLADTAVGAARHPVRGVGGVARLAAATTTDVAVGIFGKRLALR